MPLDADLCRRAQLGLGCEGKQAQEFFHPSDNPLIRLGRGWGVTHTIRRLLSLPRARICAGLEGRGKKPCDPLGCLHPPRRPLYPPSRAPPPGQGLVPTRSAPTATHRPLTLGRAPPHLTLPRRGSPLSLRRAGTGRGAPLAHAHWGPAPPPVHPGLAPRTRAESEDASEPGCGERGSRYLSLPAGGAQAAVAPRTAPGRRGRGALLCARALGRCAALRVGRAQRLGPEAPRRRGRCPSSRCSEWRGG